MFWEFVVLVWCGVSWVMGGDCVRSVDLEGLDGIRYAGFIVVLGLTRVFRRLAQFCTAGVSVISFAVPRRLVSGFCDCLCLVGRGVIARVEVEFFAGGR